MIDDLSLRIEHELAVTKKRRRQHKLKGIYDELFCGHNKQSTYRSVFEDLLFAPKRKAHFLGFFMDELRRYDLGFLADAIDKRFPGIARFEVRYLSDGMTYRQITWVDTQNRQKMFANPQEAIDEAQIAHPIEYLEVRVQDQVFGGRTWEHFSPLQKPNLLVREDLSHLPPRYAKGNEESQFRTISFWGIDHNLRSMIRSYVQETGHERPPSQEVIDQYMQSKTLREQVIDAYKDNLDGRLVLPTVKVKVLDN